MVIISDKFGQLANRLFTFAHLIANAAEYNYTVINPGFCDYASYFKGTKGRLISTYPVRSTRTSRFDYSSKYLGSKFYRCVDSFVRFIEKRHLPCKTINVLDLSSMQTLEGDYPLDSKEFIKLRETSALLFCKGWQFRDNSNFQKHADYLRCYFTPTDKHILSISNLISRARKDCDLLVGIHIRQGDYKGWLNGVYFYDSTDYTSVMKNCRQLWGAKRVKYLVCSNESQDEKLFEDLNYLFGNNHELEDMYAFASCDYIIGPPSTYTMWASFYGKVPLFMLRSPKQAVTLEGFVIK